MKDHPNLRLDGARLRTWRREAGVKRDELGKRLGYSGRTVKAWELGARKMPLPAMRQLTATMARKRFRYQHTLYRLYDELDEW